MKLKLLHIISFGGLTNYEIRLDDRVNVLCGANESGKSSAAMFIKFVFYGLSAKSPKNGEPSERTRYINRLTGQAAGYIILETDEGREYRLERAILTSDDAPARERVRIIDRVSGESFTGKDPGEYFFGVSEEVFVNTCFVGQNALIRPDIGSVGTAVENLLSSADENIDIKKAIRTIDSVRREICHKNGGGGELGELREKRAALEEEVRRSSDTSATVLRLSGSLKDIERRIGELTEDKRRCDGIFAALDKVMLKRRIDNAESIERNIAALKDTLSELEESPLGGSFAADVDEVERDVRAAVEACSAYGNGSAGVSEAVEDGDPIPDVFSDMSPSDEYEREEEDTAENEVAAEAQRLEKRAHDQFTAAMSLFIAGLFGFGLTLLLYWFNTQMYILPLLFTLVFVTLGGVFMIKNTKNSARLSNLLSEHNVSSIDELTEGTEVERVEDVPSPDESELSPSALLAAQAERHFTEALARVDELCAAAGVEPSEDVFETLEQLRTTAADIRADRETMTEKLANLCGKLEVLNEQLADVDRVNAEYEYLEAVKQPFGQTAASLTADGIKKLIRERDYTNGALRSAELRRTELKSQIEALGRPAHTPDEAASALDALDRRIEELSLRHDACELAKEALTQAGDKLRADLIPRIARSASVLFSGATGGTHETVTLDKSLRAGCSTETDVLEGEHLSRGTSDLVYLSLRLALAEEIFRGEAPFMVFDESFAHIDIKRVEAAISLMLDGQYLILTCRREEAICAERCGAARLEI